MNCDLSGRLPPFSVHLSSPESASSLVNNFNVNVDLIMPAATPEFEAKAAAKPGQSSSTSSLPPSLDLSARLPKLTPRRKAPPQQPSLPYPETPCLPPPPPISNHTFFHPTRRILSPHDHHLFLNSPTYTLLTAFVFSLSDSVQDIPCSATEDIEPLHPSIKGILRILDDAQEVIDRCPREDLGGSRFGNPGFRKYLDEIGKLSFSWHQSLGIQDENAINEVQVYFLESFGSRTRLDYGSGHELNFIVWL